MQTTAIEHGLTIYSSGHVMGTYRMGTDPKTSVVSPEQRLTITTTCSSSILQAVQR